MKKFSRRLNFCIRFTATPGIFGFPPRRDDKNPGIFTATPGNLVVRPSDGHFPPGILVIPPRRISAGTGIFSFPPGSSGENPGISSLPCARCAVIIRQECVEKAGKAIAGTARIVPEDNPGLSIPLSRARIHLLLVLKNSGLHLCLPTFKTGRKYA